LNASRVVLSSNVPINRDGIAIWKGGRLTDPGVAIYFTLKGEQRVLACDRWERIEENLRALELSIDAMRGLDRWGASDMINRVFTGFTALPAPAAGPSTWWQIIGVDRDSSLEEVEKHYRAQMRKAHPDSGGGSHELAQKLNHAIVEARREKAKEGAA
jgi:DnaJ-domain-containing protein 1